MSKMKKTVGIMMILAMLMTLTFGLSVQAGTITVRPANSLSLIGASFQAFKIFDLDYDVAGDAYIYTLNDDYKDFEDTYYAAELGGLSLKEYLDALSATPDDAGLYALARALWNYSLEEGLDLGPAVGPDTSGNIKFEDLDPGYYIVAGKAANAVGSDAMSFAMLCTVKTEDSNTDITIKADVPELKKEVLNDHNDGYEKWTDASIGTPVTFKITTTIPDTNGYESYTYIIHDTMSKGLTFVPGSIEVSILGPGAGTLAAGTDYTVSAITKDATTGVTTFSVQIKSDLILSLSTADSVELLYKATLNGDAIIGGVGNDNRAYLEYSNDPNWDGSGGGDEPTGDTPEDDAWVYTYDLDIVKFTGDEDEPVYLPGVQFVLYIADSTSVGYFTEAGGVYKVAKFDTADTPMDAACVLTTNSDGKIKIEGLDEGSYTLVEYKRLDGYNPIEPIDIFVYNVNLHEVNSDGNLDDIAGGVAWMNANRGKAGSGDSLAAYLDKVGQDAVWVYNGSGKEFPTTGGIGRRIFIIGGAALMLGAIIALSVRRKMAKAIY